MFIILPPFGLPEKVPRVKKNQIYFSIIFLPTKKEEENPFSILLPNLLGPPLSPPLPFTFGLPINF